jgi:uncharacterized membrane protein YhaH (DUF805 family)
LRARQGFDQVLLIVLALLWVAILIPIAVRRLRDDNTERSIESFHAERDVLSRQELAHSPPAFDDRPAVRHPDEYEPVGRPRLTVVHDEDTYGSIESRSTWDEWNQSYNYDRDVRAPKREEMNRYAAAYASVPGERFSAGFDPPYYERVSMKVRRRRIMVALFVIGALFTGLNVVTKSGVLEDAAIAAWLALAAFFALALVALGLGYLSPPTLLSGRAHEYDDAPIAPLYPATYGDYEERYETQGVPSWPRESLPRRALG